MIAVLEAHRAGLLNKANWLPNIISGAIVGLIALPLAMAFAIASGAKPEQGLYTAIVAGLAVSVFGGSRVQVAGPTGAFIVILSSITLQYGMDGLQIATIMAGIMLLLLGIARLGGVIRFIPAPVIVGFTSGIAVIIWVGQWQDFFGLPAVSAQHLHEKVWRLLLELPQLHPITTALSLLALLLIMGTPKVPLLKRVPGPLVALGVVTALQALCQFDGVATIGSAFGGIPTGLPTLSVPHVDLSRIIELVGPAFTIMMLGSIESLLSAVVADGMSNTRHDPNQELIGQGIANIVAPLFGGFAATGAIARTATNVRNGGNSPLSGIVHSVTLICIILFLAPLAVNVPLAALAAILFVVAWNMSDARHFIRMIRRAPAADVAILLITFGLTVLTDLVVAVNIGVILATLQFLRRMSGSVAVERQTTAQLQRDLLLDQVPQLPPGVVVYCVDGPIFFGAVETFERAFVATHAEAETLIIRLYRVPFIDITAIQTLEAVILDLRKRKVRIVLTEANARVMGKLQKAGIIELVGAGNVYSTLTAACSALEDNSVLPVAAPVGTA